MSQGSDVIERAVAQHVRGNLGEARELYSLALKDNPNQVQALGWLGAIEAQQGNLSAALGLLKKAFSLDAHAPGVAINLSNALFASRDFAEAIETLRVVLRSKEGGENALSLLSEAYREQGRLRRALTILRRREREYGDSASLRRSRGNVLLAMSMPQSAVRDFTRAIECDPENLEGWMGLILSEQKRGGLREALYAANRAYAISNTWRVRKLRVALLLELSRPANARATLEIYDETARQDPDFHKLWGDVYIAEGAPRLALEAYDLALEMGSSDSELFSGRGNALYLLERYAEALRSFDYSLERRPSSPHVWSNRGNTLCAIGKYDDALSSYDSALALDPLFSQASLNKGITLLRLGDFEQGLNLYESRWHVNPLKSLKRSIPGPEWSGQEDLCGKRILVYAEQGFGDTIQFSRYVPLLNSLGASVILQVQSELVVLLSTISGLSCCISLSDSVPSCHFHCSIVSLPRHFKTRLFSIPPPARLSVSPDSVRRWEMKVGRKRRFRVAIAWSSFSGFNLDHSRSIPFGELRTAFESIDLDLLCAQQAIKSSDSKSVTEVKRLSFYGHELTDFEQTAAMLSQCDLVISTCTSIAHLAGSLGIPTWVLLGRNPDWRWFVDRSDSPWYPSVRLFRRCVEEDTWIPLMLRVRSALEEKMKRSW